MHSDTAAVAVAFTAADHGAHFYADGGADAGTLAAADHIPGADGFADAGADSAADHLSGANRFADARELFLRL